MSQSSVHDVVSSSKVWKCCVIMLMPYPIVKRAHRKSASACYAVVGALGLG